MKMALVTTNPHISNIYRLLYEARRVDSTVQQWPAEEVDACLDKLAGLVSLVHNKKALKKKLQRTDKTTFHDGQPVTLHEQGAINLLVKNDMVEETVRYLTFVRHSWPTDAPVSPSVLAKAGFFYIGADDTVQCFSCSGRINNWAPGDTAMGEHRRLYPRCKFVRGMDTRNIPARGLIDEGSKGSGKKWAKSRPSASPQDEAGCFENSLENLVGSLQIGETEDPEPLAPSTASYFKDELKRLLTFKHWSITSPVDKFDLAADGFYCINESTGIVQCFACFGRLSDWKLGDRPKVEHKRKFPSCPFVSGGETGNKPLTTFEKEYAVKFFSEGPSLRQPQQIAANLPEASGFESSNERSAPTDRTVHPPTTATTHDPQDLTVKYAKYPPRAYEQARLETYSRWPRNHSQIPANLARAGFFATGNEDEVKCFYCGGGLKDWDVEDDPWEEHARWFSRCEWLLQQRGPGFVDAVGRKYGPSEAYFQLNQNTRNGPPPVSSPTPREEVRIPPHQFTVTSLTPGTGPRQTEPQRKPEAKKKETKKQPPKKKQQEKKKQGKKNKSLEERVEEQLRSDMVKFMLDMGSDEAIVRSTIRKRLQSGGIAFESSEQLLNSIFEEEELQQKGASNAEPRRPDTSEERQQSEYEPLRGSMESMSAAKNGSPEHSREQPGRARESDIALQLFSQFKLKLADHLTVENCLRISTLVGLTWAQRTQIQEDRNPAMLLLDMLEERAIITVSDVGSLEDALRELNLLRAAREVTEYRAVISRMGNQARSLVAEEPTSLSDEFEPELDFVEVLNQLSEFLSRSNIDHLCTYFTLTRSEKDGILSSSNPAQALMMFLYKRGTIKPDDVLFLSEGLKELNLIHAAGKLDLLLRAMNAEEEEQQSGDLQSEEIEKLREKNLCKICLDQNVEMLFLPCKHLVTCADCATRLDMCPICRGSIEDKIYVYMP